MQKTATEIVHPAAEPIPGRLPSGGFRLCLRRPAMLPRWFLSRRFRHAVELRKHVWKILCSQRDLLSTQAVSAVEGEIGQFDQLLRSAPSREELEAGAGRLEQTANKWLKPYPNQRLRENVEVFLVAIGVAMAIRTFFLQPFKIPTGSMQPTLYGVHFEDLRDRNDVQTPGPLGRFFTAVFRGDFYHEIIAQADGEVADVQPHRSFLFINYQDVVLRYTDGTRRWEKKERVWFSPVDGHGGDLRGLGSLVGWDQPVPCLPLRPTFRKGEYVLRLKDSAGDHLFVDRVTYNFRPPRRGEIIVFETKGIPNVQQDQFYIKRLVALGGEAVRIGDDRHLIIDGQRLDHTTPHFERVYGFQNAPPRESQYSGHVNGTIARQFGKNPQLAAYFRDEQTAYRLRPAHYMVMGDNTLNSYDSRGWGDFPQTNVVGRYCFVWWPFTDRFGSRAK